MLNQFNIYLILVCVSDIDECASNPCQNGGVCIDQINQYICICQAGWRGAFCNIGKYRQVGSRVSREWASKRTDSQINMIKYIVFITRDLTTMTSDISYQSV